MKTQLKPIDEQVIVLTGATSGIGLVTARMAAEQGATLALAARNSDALDKLGAEITGNGGTAIVHVIDVANEGDMNAFADRVVDTYGRIDTWINNAGVSIYGKLDDVPSEDSRRLFETNFWGVVNGSLAAARKMRGQSGAIINIGSTLSDVAIPLQGMYCASKHAVKGFTDALRMELEAEGEPIAVTLIKPSAIDTPYKDHAKNYLGVQPENPPPVYAPEAAAEAILYCAENPVRDVFVGMGGKAMSLIGDIAPRTTDRIMEKTMIDLQRTDVPQYENPKEGLYASGDQTLTERGGYQGYVAETSMYTQATLHPLAAGAVMALGVGGLAYILGRSKGLRSEIGH